MDQKPQQQQSRKELQKEPQRKTRWHPTRKQVLRAVSLTVVIIVVTFLALRIARQGFFLPLGNAPYATPTMIVLQWLQLGVLTLTVLVILIRLGYRFKWTGFGENVRPKTETQDVQRAKTLWDWLQLLVIPAVLTLGVTIGGAWFTEQRAREDALQSYLDQMGSMLLDEDLPKAEEGENVRTLARARTVTVLERLGSQQKRSVIQFLKESDLITRGHTVIDLREADLRDASLVGADLSNTDLSGANLTSADLRSASLNGANLRQAHLRDADLRDADLSEADLTLTIIESAQQLTSARSLKEATMPDGSKHD